jgi:hypothetical protein
VTQPTAPTAPTVRGEERRASDGGLAQLASTAHDLTDMEQRLDKLEAR